MPPWAAHSFLPVTQAPFGQFHRDVESAFRDPRRLVAHQVRVAEPQHELERVQLALGLLVVHGLLDDLDRGPDTARPLRTPDDRESAFAEPLQ